MTLTPDLETAAAPSVTEQVERLVALGLPQLAGTTPAACRRMASPLTAAPEVEGDPLVAVHPDLVPPSRLTPLLRLGARTGFVVLDLDDFAPVEGLDVPQAPLYLVVDVDRGDDLRGRTPDDALPVITGRGRSPLTIGEGVSWLLQRPDRLEPGHCFMCVGSRRRTARGLDPRTPAVWISGGTGRDGRERRGAPKVGWCWAGNHHSWLGFASAAARRG